mgnify:CR=1 FL=1
MEDVKQLYNLSDKRGDQKEEDLGQEYSQTEAQNQIFIFL